MPGDVGTIHRVSLSEVKATSQTPVSSPVMIGRSGGASTKDSVSAHVAPTLASPGGESPGMYVRSDWLTGLGLEEW